MKVTIIFLVVGIILTLIGLLGKICAVNNLTEQEEQRRKQEYEK